MRRLWLWLVVALALVVAGAGLSSYPRGALAGYAARPPADPLPEDSEPLPAGASIETVLDGLDSPVALAFDPQGRLFFTEKDGRVRLYADGTLQVEPVATFAVRSGGEQGLLGIALDPDFADNHYIYVFYTQAAPDGADTENKVVRFVENNGVGSDEDVVFSSFNSAGTSNHNGGNIHFGPDGKLYITIGDDARSATAQDLSVPHGKLHRVNPDGSIPDDNPDFGTGAMPSIYARGLRNSFDFAFDPTNGTPWASENGPGCDDELNRILPAGNYGWRGNYPCESHNPHPEFNTIPPLWYLPQSNCCVAPTGVEFYRGRRLAGWENTLFMCDYNSGRMRHFYLDDSREQVTEVSVVAGVRCSMDVETGPDGALYYLDGGGYAVGTLRRISGPQQQAPTATSVPPTPAAPTPQPTRAGELISTADPLFYQVWERVDRPVLELRANRSWTWGPRGWQSLNEPYAGETRLVQYFDKARMELNPASAGNPAFVTNGLLVVEMIAGQVQVGPESYEARAPSTLLIGGDNVAESPAPSYAALAGVASLQGENQAKDRTGQPVTATLDREGRAGEGGPAVEVSIATFAPQTGHNIPNVFWDFLNGRGTVYENGSYQEDLILDWVFTVGYPLTEPYWTTMLIPSADDPARHEVQNVLIQAYQRQVLTYIPGYQPPWHVQFGNVGQHYYSWRYDNAP